MNAIRLPLLGLLLIVTRVFAADPDCRDVATTQPALNACAAEEYAAADKRLNQVYRQILEVYADDGNFLENLRAAQRAWLQFRDAEIAALYPYQDEGPAYYGSAFSMCKDSRLAELTRQRTEELQRWLEGREEGDICAGSVRSRDMSGSGSGDVTFSDAGVGAISTSTPFDRDVLQRKFPDYTVNEEVAMTEGEEFAIYEIADQTGVLLTINPDHMGGIFSVVSENEAITDASGNGIGSRFDVIYTAIADVDCYPGMEEYSGTVSCLAPGADHVYYLFTGSWQGPDGQLPPDEVLADWAVDAIFWRPR